VNDLELVTDPLSVVTVIGPVVAPAGTVVVIWESDVTANAAVFPLN
jgi:hypothetical protein